jgi:hypothetical protein
LTPADKRVIVRALEKLKRDHIVAANLWLVYKLDTPSCQNAARLVQDIDTALENLNRRSLL